MSATEEVWKDIPGYEGQYQASTFGHIKRLEHVRQSGRRASEKILQPSATGDGHLQVFVGGKLHTVHSLVLLTFVGPRPSDKPHIRHLDDDPSNNKLSNIVYGTAQENALDRERARKAKGLPLRYSKERALQIKAALEKKLAWTYKEMAELGRLFGVSCITVRRIRDGIAWNGLVEISIRTATVIPASGSIRTPRNDPE